MSPAITLALLSVNVVAMACSVYFAQQAATTAVAIRTGSAQGVRLSKQHRFLLLQGVWIAPVISEFALTVTLCLFNLQIAAHTASEGPRLLANLSVFFWGLAAVSTLSFAINDAFGLYAAVRDDSGA
jgi:hypothetical protein